MMSNFIVVRHGYDDHSYIDGKNDTSLTENGIKVAENAIIGISDKIESNDVIIRHSIKKRAFETGKIFCDYLNNRNFNCRCIAEPGLTELYQGEFDFTNLTHSERVEFLQSCWNDFEESRLNGDYTHRFGINKDKSIILTPGENHLEWSNKIVDAYFSIINDMEKGIQSFNIGHRGVIYMLERLTLYVNKKIDVEEIEQYKTRWMEYCQAYKLTIDNTEKAKVLLKEYKNKRKIK